MIIYNNHEHCRLCRVHGSVFPVALAVSVPVGLFCSLLKFFFTRGLLEKPTHSLVGAVTDKAAWTIYSGLVGFLLVFRMSQAYIRFWDGCSAAYGMRQYWVNACALLAAYIRRSKSDLDRVQKFQGKLVRLLSMMHAVALAELEELNVPSGSPETISAHHFEVMDPVGFDDDSLRIIKSSTTKVEQLFAWTMHVVVQGAEEGIISIPPPVLSQVIQMLCKGLDHFKKSLQITYIPIPFPYIQTCDFLILLHCILTPLVMVEWVNNFLWAGILAFLQVFTIQALTQIALEIENPFGSDDNDFDGEEFQRDMNDHLALLTRPSIKRLPRLGRHALEEFEFTEGGKSWRQPLLNVLNSVGGDHNISGRKKMKKNDIRRSKVWHGGPVEKFPEDDESSDLNGEEEKAKDLSLAEEDTTEPAPEPEVTERTLEPEVTERIEEFAVRPPWPRSCFTCCVEAGALGHVNPVNAQATLKGDAVT